MLIDQASTICILLSFTLFVCPPFPWCLVPNLQCSSQDQSPTWLSSLSPKHERSICCEYRHYPNILWGNSPSDHHQWIRGQSNRFIVFCDWNKHCIFPTLFSTFALWRPRGRSQSSELRDRRVEGAWFCGWRSGGFYRRDRLKCT